MPIWIIATQWVSRSILLILFGLSIWSVTIILDRRKKLMQATESPERMKSLYEILSSSEPTAALKDWAQKKESGISGTIHSLLDSPRRDAESLALAAKSFLAWKKSEWENGLTVLATLGANAPFIGLFGTVLGIIQAFGVLGNSQSGTATVMTGISEALVATAVGLFVAIPAVVAYNIYSRQLKVLLTQCESIRDFYLSRLKRE